MSAITAPGQTANVADDVIRDILDALEGGLGRLPVDDSWRHGLLQVRRALRMRLGQDPLSEAPAPLAQVLALMANNATTTG